jgi:hypothetical protein
MMRSLSVPTRAALLAVLATPLLLLVNRPSAAEPGLAPAAEAAFEALNRARLEEELVRAERTAIFLTEIEHGLEAMAAEADENDQGGTR